MNFKKNIKMPKVTHVSGFGNKTKINITDNKKMGWKNILSHPLKHFLYFFLSALFVILEFISLFVQNTIITIVETGIILMMIFITICLIHKNYNNKI